MRKLLFSIARSPAAGWFIGFAFAHLTKLMPLDRLYEDAHGILFLHPKPYWRTHWLGVPKQAIASFAALDWAHDGELVVGIVEQLLQRAQSLEGHKAIIVNGGAYQDVPQLHFHLAHGGLVDGEAWDYVGYVEGGAVLSAENNITTTQIDPTHWHFSGPEATLSLLFQIAHKFVTTQSFSAYTIQYHFKALNNAEPLAIHLFAN